MPISAGATITASKTKMLILTGEVDVKMELLRRMFTDAQPTFEKLPIYVRIDSKDKQGLLVYVLPFFNNQNLSLQVPYILANYFIVPDYYGRNRPALPEEALNWQNSACAEIEELPIEETSIKKQSVTYGELPDWFKTIAPGTRFMTSDKHPEKSQRHRDVMFEGISKTGKIRVRLYDKRNGQLLDTIYNSCNPDWFNPLL